MLEHKQKRAPLAVRGDDLYETPACAVESLLLVEGVTECVWEPACGRGTIARVLREHGRTVWASDLINYDSPDQDTAGIDFLMEHRNWPGHIVTNPPFKLAEQFVAKALECAPKVMMLLRLAFMESERRTKILENGWLARVWVYRKRLPMMHRDGWEGKKGNSGMAFAWFVWDKQHHGPTTIHRLSWEKAI